MSSGKCRPSCLGLNVLMECDKAVSSLPLCSAFICMSFFLDFSDLTLVTTLTTIIVIAYHMLASSGCCAKKCLIYMIICWHVMPVKQLSFAAVNQGGIQALFATIDSHPFHINRPSRFRDTAILLLTLKIPGKGNNSHNASNIISTDIPLIPCQSALPFLRYSFFKIWPWKSKAKVIGGFKVQTHKVDLTSYQLTSISFHVNPPSSSWIMFFI